MRAHATDLLTKPRDRDVRAIDSLIGELVMYEDILVSIPRELAQYAEKIAHADTADPPHIRSMLQAGLKALLIQRAGGMPIALRGLADFYETATQ
jgi:hypothetical protein